MVLFFRPTGSQSFYENLRFHYILMRSRVHQAQEEVNTDGLQTLKVDFASLQIVEVHDHSEPNAGERSSVLRLPTGS